MVLQTQCGLANGDHCTRAVGAAVSQCSYSDEERPFKWFEGTGRICHSSTSIMPPRQTSKSNEHRPEHMELTVWGDAL